MTIGLSKVEAIFVEWGLTRQIGIKRMRCRDIKTVREDNSLCKSSYNKHLKPGGVVYVYSLFLRQDKVFIF